MEITFLFQKLFEEGKKKYCDFRFGKRGMERGFICFYGGYIKD